MLQKPSLDEMQNSRLAAFLNYIREETDQEFGALGPEAYAKLHRWSVDNVEQFYSEVLNFSGLIYERGKKGIENIDDILDAEFFPDTKISFTENMLKRVKTHPDDQAIIARTAGRDEDRILSWKELSNEVSRWSQALEKLGVGEGDRVATYLPHGPEAYILMMAVANRGAIFSSVGTEMGAQATAARFAQIEPKVLIAADGYMHMKTPDQPGKRESRIELIKRLLDEVPSFEAAVVVPNLDEQPDISTLGEKAQLSTDLMANIEATEIEFTRRPFNQPLAILFSSGSTGKPKCFVHGVGGTLLKHAVEHQLQGDVRAGDRVFFHSTTSWMMFNWLASGLANDATILLYDGNPAYPAMDAQLQFTSEYECTHLGTAAAIVQDLWMRAGVKGEGFDLSPLRAVMYTGSVLSEAGYLYINQNIKDNLSIEGVCGGTDFVGCYAMGNAFSPTIAGQLKGPVLGMDVDVWTDDGLPQAEGHTGELVVKNAFASRPVEFWNDPGKARFRGEYFEYFDCDPPVWRHGDAVKKMPMGQMLVEGRSDSTLNQGGVRIGTQQLYDALNHPDLAGIVVDSLAASFKDAQSGDHTVLFVVLADGHTLDEALKKSITGVFSDSVGRLSCPHEVIEVPYVLKTPNGKKAEKPTAQLLRGEDVKAPETYGTADDGALKTEIYKGIGERIRANPAYGFVPSV